MFIPQLSSTLKEFPFNQLRQKNCVSFSSPFPLSFGEIVLPTTKPIKWSIQHRVRECRVRRSWHQADRNTGAVQESIFKWFLLHFYSRVYDLHRVTRTSVPRTDTWGETVRLSTRWPHCTNPLTTSFNDRLTVYRTGSPSWERGAVGITSSFRRNGYFATSNASSSNEVGPLGSS